MTLRHLPHILLSVTWGLWAGPALAACSLDYEFFESGPVVALAVVQGSGDAHLYKDGGGCPAMRAACQGRAVVMPGDRVILGRGKGEFFCAMFPGGKGGAIGWIDRSRVRILPAPAQPAPVAWVGRWNAVNGNARIGIAAINGGLNADGNASWSPPDHSVTAKGAFHAAINRSGNNAQLIDGKCQVRFTLLADMLLANAADACGEVNVSFTGVYLRPVDGVKPMATIAAVKRPAVRPKVRNRPRPGKTTKHR